jgi:hypothetical protein
MTEFDLEVYDVWESPNGNLFIKVSDEYSIAIGTKGDHTPNEIDLKRSSYVKASSIVTVKKVGKIIFE